MANKCYYTTVLWQMISSVETKSVTLFAPFCYFVYTIYITLLLLNSRTLSECMCLVFWTTTLSKCTFEIGQVNIYNFYLNMSDVLLPYPLILFKSTLSDIIFIWFEVFRQDNCITLTKNKTLFLVFFAKSKADVWCRNLFCLFTLSFQIFQTYHLDMNMTKIFFLWD